MKVLPDQRRRLATPRSACSRLHAADLLIQNLRYYNQNSSKAGTSEKSVHKKCFSAFIDHFFDRLLPNQQLIGLMRPALSAAAPLAAPYAPPPPHRK